MDTQSLIEQVNQKTERRAASKLNLRVEMFLALDELCIDRRFWWRRKRLVLPLTIGDASYDLSQIAPMFTEFDKVYLVGTDNTIHSGCELSPLFDPEAQLAATLETTNATPAGYFIDSDTSFQTLRLAAPSNVDQNLVASYWAVPMINNPDSNTEDIPIPLLPGYLHWVLYYGLEKRVYEFLYGQLDPRFAVSNSRYKEGLVLASRIPSWAQGQVSEIRLRDSNLAVQAH